MPNIKLPDGKKIEFSKSITGLEIAKKISSSLAKEALIISVNGILKDLNHEIKILILRLRYLLLKTKMG